MAAALIGCRRRAACRPSGNLQVRFDPGDRLGGTLVRGLRQQQVLLAVLARLRAICLALPEATQIEQRLRGEFFAAGVASPTTRG